MEYLCRLETQFFYSMISPVVELHASGTSCVLLVGSLDDVVDLVSCEFSVEVASDPDSVVGASTLVSLATEAMDSASCARSFGDVSGSEGVLPSARLNASSRKSLVDR